MAVLGYAAMKDEAITLKSLFLFQGYGGQMATILIIIILQNILFAGIMALLEYIKIAGRKPSGIFGSEDKLMKQVESGPRELIEEAEENEDIDVVRERERVLSDDSENNDILRIVDVHKVYREKNKKLKHAVNGVYLGVQSGTCLGLLGPNGAGKTSLINVLSGMIGANRGDVYLNHYNIFSNVTDAYRSLGVCAQTDRLWEKLSAREHIKVFSTLRGVYSKEYVQKIIDEFQMEDIADQESKTLSGGQKRKLCVALAFIGEPSVVMLDEPSSGMDVATRRLLWNKIISLKENRAIVLTSHSMEEIDALCSNICIMVNGRLRCIGSSQHLKSRFGSGYRLSVSSELCDNTREWVLSTFKDAKLSNEVAQMQHFEIPKGQGMSLSFLFEQLEENKHTLGVVDYSISEATLEQVFLSFASNQI
jgi:ABC-type multidrug transport system ATPase subunit